MVHWDVIIVGARCGGAALASLLARRGKRVALLEASERGTDMPMSTHLMQPPGMDVLDRLGIGSRVRAAAPPSHYMRLALDDASAIAPMPEGRPAYCIRRALLDPWLQQTAEESGATLLDRHRVVELLWEGPRVVGVVARTPQGAASGSLNDTPGNTPRHPNNNPNNNTVELRAPLVVGADGPHSTVAARVAAHLGTTDDYLVCDGSRAGYWSYYDAPATWTANWDTTLEHQGQEVRYAFRCDSQRVLLFYMGPREQVAQWGKNYRERLHESLLRSETLRPLCEGKTPLGNTMGLLKMRFFYRKPVGQGWMLIGDAGHFKDFVTGQGMTDALLDAEHASAAILDGRAEAYEHFWRERDVRTLPLHFDAIRQGEVGYNTPLVRWLIARGASRPDVIARMRRVFDRKLAPGALFPKHVLAGLLLEALVKGRFDVLAGFASTARRMVSEAVELDRRTRLAAKARAALAVTPLLPQLTESAPAQAAASSS